MGCGKSKVGEAEKEIDLSVTSEGRKCTDILCLLVFIVFSVVFFGVGAFAMATGDPYRVIYATDYEGNTCGTGGRGQYAYYPRLSDDLADAVLKNPGVDLTSLSPDMINLYGICVESCPTMNSVICDYDVTDVPTTDAMSSKCNSYVLRQINPICQQCWVVPLNSANVLYRCLWEEASVTTETEKCVYPSVDEDVTSTNCISKQVIEETINIKPAQENSVIDSLSSFGGTISKWMGDIQKTIPVILGCGVAVSTLMGFAWLIVLQYCAGVIVWTTLWGSVFLSFAASMFALYQAGYFTIENLTALTDIVSQATNITVNITEAVSATNGSFSQFESSLPDSVVASGDNTTYWAIGGWALLAITVVLLCVCVAMAKKVRRAIGVLKEASKAIQDIYIIVAYPIVTLVFMIMLISWYIVSSASIKSLGSFSLQSLNVSDDVTAVTNTSSVSEFSESELATPLTWFNLFGFLWWMNFIQGIGMMVVAGTIGQWYFTREEPGKKKNLPNSTLFKAISRTFKFHLGSVAFGSFIIAVVQFIRIVLEYVDKQTKDLQNSNGAVKFLMCFVKACLWCFEKCIKFLSFNAYILVATRGTAFIPSACKAFKLILANVATIGVLNLVAAFMMVLGKMFIMLITMFTAYAWIQNAPEYAAATATTPGGTSELSNKFIPLGLIALIAYMMACSFLNVYGMALDTIMLCFCYDLEVFGEDAPADKYYMGDSLKASMGFKKSQLKKEKKESNKIAPAGPEAPPAEVEEI